MNSIALNASALGESLTARTADGRQVSEVFLVACGGSLVDLTRPGTSWRAKAVDCAPNYIPPTSSFTPCQKRLENGLL